MYKFFSTIIFLSALVVMISGCTDREKAPVEAIPPIEGESYAYISTHPDDPFISDSVDVVVQSTTGGNLFIFSFTAYENPDQGEDKMSFTVFGILMPGTKTFYESTVQGVAAYYNHDLDRTYISAAVGGEGTIDILTFEEPYEHVIGEFNLSLTDTLTGEMVTITDGFFDTDVDTLQ